MEKKHFYHAATKGLDSRVIFTSTEQFIAGMNRVALCKLSVPGVIVIAFVLMDNHVHFILHGTYADCMRFMAQYKKLTQMWLSNNSPDSKIDFWEYNCWPIPNKEKLTEKICYVLRNPLAAGMGVLPTSYLWGSGPLMFSGGATSIWGKLSPIGELSVYQLRKTFGTKLPVPSDWLKTEDGLIWPGCYVNFKHAEQAFGSIVNFMFEQNHKNEDLINQEMYGSDISLPDSDIIAILSERSDEEFGIADLSLLTPSQRIELCRLVRKSHGTDIKQLGRVLHIKLQDINKIWQ